MRLITPSDRDRADLLVALVAAVLLGLIMLFSYRSIDRWLWPDPQNRSSGREYQREHSIASEGGILDGSARVGVLNADAGPVYSRFPVTPVQTPCHRSFGKARRVSVQNRACLHSHHSGTTIRGGLTAGI